jgi:hypothetical protein
MTQPPPAAGEGHRVVLYVRQGCHLCDDAREVLAEVVGRADDGRPGWAEVDIDTVADDGDLVARYGDLVPVVTVDGVQQAFWRVDGARVRRALEAGR